MFISTAPGLVQFPAVEGNGFFAEHMFARCQRRQQITDMRIMGRRNIDDIDVGIRKDILWLVVDLGDAVFFSKSLGLFMVRLPTLYKFPPRACIAWTSSLPMTPQPKVAQRYAGIMIPPFTITGG